LKVRIFLSEIADELTKYDGAVVVAVVVVVGAVQGGAEKSGEGFIHKMGHC